MTRQGKATAWAAPMIAAISLLALTSARADEASPTSDIIGADWAPVAESELGIQRGGAESRDNPDVVMVGESTQNGTVTGNSVGDGSTTGAMSFVDSFHNNTGIQSSMVNSGNNVSMQSSMTVNIYLD